MMFQTLERCMPPGTTLAIECKTCGRSATWSRGEAFRLLRPDATPVDVRRRLTCADCGGHARVSTERATGGR